MSDRSVEHPYYNPDRFPLFAPPHPSIRFFEVAYDVSGKTRAQNERITFAQDELLSCLLMDPHVTSRLQRWSASVGLPEIETRLWPFSPQPDSRKMAAS